jgi:hypothetical protein
MPPQQPGVSPNGQYDFIVNPTGYRQTSNWLLQAPLKTRLLVFGGGVFGLLLIIWIFIALLSAGGNANVQNLTTLAQEQAELARISFAATQNATSGTAKNLASTVRLSIDSDEQLFVQYLGNLNAAPSSDTLAQGANPQTDVQLTNAQTSGTYDQTYTTIVTQQLTTYASDLKKTFNSMSDANERQLLSGAYQHAQLLLTLADSN